MKLYNDPKSKYENVKKTMLRHWKRRNKLYFQEVYCHVNKFVYSIPQYRRQILTYPPPLGVQGIISCQFSEQQTAPVLL